MSFSLNSYQYRTRGSIHNLTFYTMNGSMVVRAKAVKVHNPKTPSQQANRKNILPLIEAYKQIKPVLYKSLNYRTSKRKAYHEFLSLNLNHSIVNGLFIPSNFKVSGNCFNSTPINIENLQSGINNLKFTWSTSIIANQSNSDLFCLVTYNSVNKNFSYQLTNISRSIGEFSTFINLGSDPSANYFYSFFVKSNYSNSGQASVTQL